MRSSVDIVVLSVEADGNTLLLTCMSSTIIMSQASWHLFWRAQVLLEQVEWGGADAMDKDHVEFQLQDLSAATLARLAAE